MDSSLSTIIGICAGSIGLIAAAFTVAYVFLKDKLTNEVLKQYATTEHVKSNFVSWDEFHKTKDLFQKNYVSKEKLDDTVSPILEKMTEMKATLDKIAEWLFKKP